ncbi:MAG: Pr6Pr family membrane protein [Pseudolysinimonas sp.]
MRPLFAVFRVIAAAAITVAIVGQLLYSLDYRAGLGAKDVGAFLINFFSFFTIESNVLSVAALLIGAVLLFATKGVEGRWYTILRLITTTYMTVTFVVYNLLLRNVELPQGTTLEWSNEILHVIGPLCVIVDWLFAPGRGRLEWKHIWAVVIFPVAWAAYTLIRGPFVVEELSGANWYPYPFLNPDTSPNGYLSVSFYVILIAAVVLGVGAAVVWVSRRRTNWPLAKPKA